MEEFDFNQGLKDISTYARDKADNILYNYTDTFGKSMGKAAIFVGFFLIAFTIFIFINITIAAILSQWLGGNYYWGFLIIAIFYLLVLGILWMISPSIKSAIYNYVATISLRKIADINQKMDSNLPDYMKKDDIETKKLNKALSKQVDENVVSSLINSSETRCIEGEMKIKQNTSYVSKNFNSILFDLYTKKILEYLSKNKYIKIALDLLIPDKNKTINNNTSNNNPSWKSSAIKIATPFVKSFLWTMAVSKLKRMIINKISPFKKKKSKNEKKIFYSN